MQHSPYCPLLVADPLSVVEYTLTRTAQALDPTFERAIRMEDNSRGNVQWRPGDQVVRVRPAWVVETETVALVRDVLDFVHRAERLYSGGHVSSYSRGLVVPELRPDHRAASFFKAEPKQHKKSPDPTDIPPEDIVAWYLSHIDKLEP